MSDLSMSILSSLISCAMGDGVQSAKKYALGPRHDIAALSGAVAEPWLSVVIKDAAAAEQSGWFWTYKLDSLEVRSNATRQQISALGCEGIITALQAHYYRHSRRLSF